MKRRGKGKGKGKEIRKLFTAFTSECVRVEDISEVETDRYIDRDIN